MSANGILPSLSLGGETTQGWLDTLTDILQVGLIGLWELELREGQGTIRPDVRLLDSFGYSEDNFARYDWNRYLENICHPADRAEAEMAIVTASESPGIVFSSTYRIWNKKLNDWHWVYCFGKSSTEKEGETVIIRGAMQDIHDHIRLNKFLEKSQKESEQTIALQDAVLQQQINERTELLCDMQIRLATLLGSLPVVLPQSELCDEDRHQHPGEEPELAVFLENDLNKSFDLIADKLAWYKAIIDSLPIPISVVDMEGSWQYLNEPGLQMLGGETLEDLVGKPAMLWNKNTNIAGDVTDGPRFFEMYQLETARFYQGQSSYLHDHNGITIGHIEIMMDMTEAHDANERIRFMLDTTPFCCAFIERNKEVCPDAPLTQRYKFDCNRATLALFGLTEKWEYIEYFDKFLPRYQPDGAVSVEKALKDIERAFETGYEKFEWVHQAHDGTSLPVEITLVRVMWRNTPMISAYIRDLREVKTAKKELDKERALLERLLESSPVCLVILVGRVVRFATPFTRYFLGLSVGDTLEQFVQDKKESRALIQAFKETGSVDWQPLRIYTKHGETKQMLINAFPAEYYGEQCAMTWLVDVTDMHNKERELRRARDLAEESTKAKSEFLANMSHEIRTPMNAILGITHLVLRTDLTERQQDYLKKVEQSAKALLRIINDILDFSKIEAGKLDMEEVEFTLESLVQEVGNVVMQKIIDKGLHYTVSLPPYIPPVLCGDSLRLHQVLLNLISNATKFTAKGSITLSVSVEKLTQNQVTLVFSVGDSGIGMTPAQVTTLFTPFMQADSSITRKYGGTGLGLAISKRLVEMMGGNIWCESVRDVGTTFYFSIPFFFIQQGAVQPPLGEDEIWNAEKLLDDTCVAAVSQSSSTALPNDTSASSLVAKSAEFPPASLRGVKVLLAEDNEINQFVALELLSIAGIQVDIANNGLEAVEKVQQGHYDLILMDIQMPEMDGLNATRAIRKMAKFAQLPIIAMTAHAMSGDREKSLLVGMSAHITKPIDAQTLYATLARWVGSSNIA